MPRHTAGGLAVGAVAFLPIAVDLRGATHLAEPRPPCQQRGQARTCLSGGSRERYKAQQHRVKR